MSEPKPTGVRVYRPLNPDDPGDRELMELWAMTDEPKLTDWRPFSEKPPRPMMVEYFHGNWPPLNLPEYRDERRALGFFDGEQFRELGTGHEVFESWKELNYLPTHWREAVESPK